MLAGELALAGVECLVLERRAGPRTDSRAICLHARSMEMLDLRGQAETFARAGLPLPSFPLGPRGARIGLQRLDSDFPYLLDIPQATIEELLAARAARLGATIGWSRQVTGIEQDSSRVRVTLADATVEDGDYAARTGMWLGQQRAGSGPPGAGGLPRGAALVPPRLTGTGLGRPGRDPPRPGRGRVRPGCPCLPGAAGGRRCQPTVICSEALRASWTGWVESTAIRPPG